MHRLLSGASHLQCALIHRTPLARPEPAMALPSQIDLQAAIAVTRFGLGARPGELEAASADPKAFLRAQIRPEGADQPDGRLAPSAENIAVFQGLRRERREMKSDGDAADQL